MLSFFLFFMFLLLRFPLMNLYSRPIQPDYSKVSTSSVQPGQIDELAGKSFPMCMRAMHRKLKTSHHLKHAGRMQYGLFLKGIGLSVENALIFWKSEFSKAMGPDVFEKTYPFASSFPTSLFK